jgi:hypothetical protein
MSHLAVELTKCCRFLHLASRKKSLLQFLNVKTNFHKPLSENGECAKFFSSNSKDEGENPIQRTMKIFKDDLRYTVDLLDGRLREEEIGRRNLVPNECDVLIVGGGVMGSSIAYWLKQRALGGLSVIVLEKDSSVINYNSSDNEVGVNFSFN